jgi:DNA-binding CsgD family transcriptional regulator/tetratricopeptide (TPR) repeat protein
MDLLERDEQLLRLQEVLARAADRRGRIVAIAGEAGAGKTSLVERFAADCASGGAQVHWGACEPLSTPEPLLPLRDIARASGGAFTFDRGADHITAFENLLHLIVGGSVPSVLVLEDMHWADAATLDLVRFLARRIARASALVLLTYRNDEGGARLPLRDVLGETPPGSVERMTLGPLSRDAVNRLAARGGRQGDELFELTGGNPFLVTEALAVEGDAPPETVRDATLARAARLPLAARTVLEAVSIFPRRADAALVEIVLGAPIETGVDACVERGMLVAEGRSLRFRHEIARRAIEASLTLAQLRQLHQRVVSALRTDPESRSSEVVHHAERAGDVAALVEYARRAGEEAAASRAFREAAAHFATVLRHREMLDTDTVTTMLERHAEQAYLMGDPEAAVRSATEAARRRREAGDAVGVGRNLTTLSRYAWVSGRRAEAERHIEQAVAVLQETPERRQLARAYSHRSQLEMLAFHYNSAIEWGERALALAEELGEQEIIIHALGTLGTMRDMPPESGQQPELLRSLQLARMHHYPDHALRAFCNLTCEAYWRRNYPASLAYIEQGLAYAADYTLTHWEAYLRGWRAMIYLDQGNWLAAESEAEEVCGWASSANLFRLPAFVALARLRVRRGDPDVESPLETARKLSEGLEEVQRSIYIAAIDAERIWLAGDMAISLRAKAVKRLQEVRAAANEPAARRIADAATLWLHLLGESVPASPPLWTPYDDLCAGRWRAAAAGWRALGHPYEEAIALSEGDDEAQRAALAIFDRLGAVPAANLLRQRMRMSGTGIVPRGPIASTRANAAGLTRRQAQVLHLLCEDLTNAEIAARLCISAKTAEHHVSAIMARLDACTRHEAARAARQRGLLESKQ